MAIVIALALFISIVERIKQGEGGKLTLWKSFLGGIK
jgi:hypothetical protein